MGQTFLVAGTTLDENSGRETGLVLAHSLRGCSQAWRGHDGVYGEVTMAGAWQSLQWLGPVGARGLLLHGANQEAKRASTGRGAGL